MLARTDLPAQPPPNSTRQEERGGYEDGLEIRRGQLGRVPAPVLEQHGAPRVGDEPLQGQHQEKDVVDLAEEWNEVRDVVEGHRDVRDRSGDEQLVQHGNASIRDEPEEETEVFRDQAYRGSQRSPGASARAACLLRLSGARAGSAPLLAARVPGARLGAHVR